MFIAEEHEVKLAIARVYHAAIDQQNRRRNTSPEEEDDSRGLMNFRVGLEEMDDHSGRLKSTAPLLLPIWGNLFKQFAKQHPVLVPYHPDWNDKDFIVSQALRIYKPYLSREDMEELNADIMHLKSTPWINPRQEKDHQDRLKLLEARCQITDIQFGFDHFEPRPMRQAGQSQTPNIHRFCVEWAKTYRTSDTMAFLHFMDELHLIQIQIGDHTSPEYSLIKGLWSREVKMKGELTRQ